METILKLIKAKGQRLTSQKKQVLLVLQKKPQTVIEILGGVKLKKVSIDKATVYRILTNLKELEIVKEIRLRDREVRYELSNCEHHHHLVCEKCGDIEDVALCEETILKEVKKQSHFKIDSHTLEFFGLCEKCQ